MEARLLESICRQIYRQFPEVAGSKPKITPQDSTHTLLIFSGKAAAADGKTISRVVRVVVNEKGKILKTTTSR
ncbi:MAG: hypothetical protein ABFD44_04470 [Anaerolineaceae bacterium]